MFLKIGYNADYYIADLSDSITENDTLPGVYRTRWNANQAFMSDTIVYSMET